tara:strand:- start:539 stop:913 length:375 start_codon:yes stop_codon:yes gene_type:complete
MKKLGIKESQVKASATRSTKGNEAQDLPQVKLARQQMKNTFLSNAKIVNSGTYYEPQYKKDSNGKLAKDSDGNKILEGYEQKQFAGTVIVDDNNDGTFTCTKLHVYKEEIQVDSDISIAQVTTK